MSVFADTSGLLAMLDVKDRFHEAAGSAWLTLLGSRVPVLTSNYVVLESLALVQKRFGMSALRDVESRILPALIVHWVDTSLHQTSIGAVLAAGRRQLGLVDCVSFEVMRRYGFTRYFGFDPHFKEQGFTSVCG